MSNTSKTSCGKFFYKGNFWYANVSKYKPKRRRKTVENKFKKIESVKQQSARKTKKNILMKAHAIEFSYFTCSCCNNNDYNRKQQLTSKYKTSTATCNRIAGRRTYNTANYRANGIEHFEGL